MANRASTRTARATESGPALARTQPTQRSPAADRNARPATDPGRPVQGVKILRTLRGGGRARGRGWVLRAALPPISAAAQEAEVTAEACAGARRPPRGSLRPACPDQPTGRGQA